MRAALLQVREGSITWDEFFRATSGDWQRLGRHLYERWPTPAGVSSEDVEQELRLAAWSLLPKWDPRRASVERFIVWNAATAAKRWLHGQRNAKRRDDGSPGRYPVPLSSLGRDDEGRKFPEPSIDAPQELATLRLERLGRVLWTLEVPEQQCLLALVAANGDVEGAASTVYDDAKVRRACRLGSEEDARRVVRRVAARAAQVVQDVTA